MGIMDADSLITDTVVATKMTNYQENNRANKAKTGDGSHRICRVIDASLSPLPDPGR